MNFADLATPLAIAGLVILAVADLALKGDATIAIAAGGGLLAFIQVRPSKPGA